MIILLYLEIFMWVLAIYAFTDIIVPLILGNKPFTIARSVFSRKKREGNDGNPSGKQFRSNRAN